MARPRSNLTETELLEWSLDLGEREAALAAEQAQFEQHVQGFQRRADEVVTGKAHDLLDAMRMVRAAFPGGFRIEPWGPEPGGSVH